jgi:cell wall-associated NlpC family hydrolase
MKFSSYLKIGFIIIPIALLLYFFSIDKIDQVLTEKIKENQTLIDKYIAFNINDTEKDIQFQNKITENVISTAESFLGTPNKIGGIDRENIDASGLVYISIKNNSDIEFPRIAQDMARYGDIILDSKDLERGDLVFFFDTYDVNRIITSVGIFIGDDEFITSSSSKGVVINRIDDPYYWSQKFFYGTRIF